MNFWSFSRHMTVAVALGVMVSSADASTVSVNTGLSYFASGNLFGPAQGAALAGRSVEFGPSAVKFQVGARVSEARFVSFVIAGVTVEFSTTLDTVEARGTTVRLSSAGVRGGVDTALDARANGAYTFVPITTGIPGVPTLNIPSVPAFEQTFRLETNPRTTGGTAAYGETLRSSSGVRFDGLGLPQLPPAFPLSVAFGGRVGGNFDLDTSYRADALSGFVLATHESGATASTPFTLDGADLLTQLDLSLEGRWTLGLADVALMNTFESGLTIRPFGQASWRVGACRGRVGSVCVTRGSTSLDGPTSGLGLSSFSIAYPTASVILGEINVLGLSAPPPSGGPGLPGGFPGTGPGSDPNVGGTTPPGGMPPVTPVPLPPALALLTASLGMLAFGVRRRRIS
ncbi:MAG: hypothetical protein ACXIUW_17295 [Roseinatronobacter sp.]